MPKKPQELPRPKGKGPRRPYYGDENYKGSGKLKCAVCGKPLRDHDHIGPCPKLGPGVYITVPKGAGNQKKKK